jgi:hypothetical protein
VLAFAGGWAALAMPAAVILCAGVLTCIKVERGPQALIAAVDVPKLTAIVSTIGLFVVACSRYEASSLSTSVLGMRALSPGQSRQRTRAGTP